ICPPPPDWGGACMLRGTRQQANRYRRPRHGDPGDGGTPCVFLSGASTASAKRAFHVPLRFALGDRVAFVVLPLTAGQGELDLGPSITEVQRQGNQGAPGLLRLPDQSGDFSAVQK